MNLQNKKCNGDRIITADAIDGLRTIQSGSVDTCITSPPYYCLRDYGAEGQIGIETTVGEYIKKLVAVFREVHRVLRDDGTLWLNLGDSYAGSGKGQTKDAGAVSDKKRSKTHGMRLPIENTGELKAKDLIGVPWLVAFALRADGWYLRQDIIWHKPNTMPESVKDRCTRSHEYIFLLSKSRKYYFNHEAIKEPRVGSDNSRVSGSAGALGSPQSRRRGSGNKERKQRPCAGQLKIGALKGSIPYAGDSEYRNCRDVWTIPTKPTKDAHFAQFPQELIRPCVLAGSRYGGIVIDPFFGAGTTGIVARKEGRRYIGIDINPYYTDMAKEALAQISMWR